MNLFPSDESTSSPALPRKRRRAGGAQHQPEAGQLPRQRAAQAQRVTSRMADEALLEAYVQAGLDAEVRHLFRGLDSGKSGRRGSRRGG